MQDLQEKYHTVVNEHDHLVKSLQSMGDISAQHAESKRAIKSAELQLTTAVSEKNKLQEQLEALNAQVNNDTGSHWWCFCVCVCVHTS